MKKNYILDSFNIVNTDLGEIYCFQFGKNVDKKTISSFGEEWTKFDKFNDEELNKIAAEYFDICEDILPNHNIYALDVGCGTGRWTKYISDKVGFVEAIDPSDAIFVAQRNLKDKKNTRVTKADVSNLPFENGTFDLVFSLGVLHHLPDTQEAINSCVKMLKKDGYFLVYLYYNLDNRGFLYRLLFNVSNLFRNIISRLPNGIKKILCDVIALFIYMPFVTLSRLLEWMNLSHLANRVPLSYYRNKSLWIIRNDALDRFGTPLEKRFSRKEIQEMLEKAGLVEIIFSEKAPYWHARGKKA